MSAPETKLKDQEKHHRAPLLGMRMVVIFALVLAGLFAVVVFLRGNEPGDGEADPATTEVPATAEEIAD